MTTSQENESTLTQPNQSPVTAISGDEVKKLNEILGELKNTMDTRPAMVSPIAASSPPEVNLDTDYSDLDEVGLDAEQSKVLTKVLEKRDQKLKEEFVRSYTSDQDKRGYNVQLETRFPDLKNTSSPLYKATVNELNVRITRNPKYLDQTPSAVYDAACVAFAELSGYGKSATISPARQITSEDRRLSSLTGGYVEGNTSPPDESKTSDITDEQREFAAQMGISTDVYKKIKYRRTSTGELIQDIEE